MVSLRQLLLWSIRGYQLALSPLLGPRCRFYPTCSCYAHTAILRHGVWRGGWLAARRLLRCHPFTPGGYDPVPEESAVREEADAREIHRIADLHHSSLDAPGADRAERLTRA
jgi:putative membrane protein insertion efficiency factor